MTAPIISVVIPTYNRARFVTAAIDSVLGQGKDECEIIVVDDGSTDNTGEVLARYQGAITYVVQKNGGVSAARNSGIRLARGEWITFLDSDDEWLPGFVSAHLDAVKRHPRIVASVMNVANVRESGEGSSLFDDRGLTPVFQGKTSMLVERPLLKFVEHRLAPILLSTLFRREELLKIDWFNPKLRIAEDLDLAGRMALRGTFHFGAQPVARLLRRQETTQNLTDQLYNSGIYTWECLQSIYDGFAADPSLTGEERAGLRRMMGNNLRTLGNLYARAGRGNDARSAYRQAVKVDFCFASIARYLTSLLPERVLLHTIRKGRQIQPGQTGES
jgi:glycosyltransferase involved in cell wall biosynthesis